jgi:hypothetical protein
LVGSGNRDLLPVRIGYGSLVRRAKCREKRGNEGNANRSPNSLYFIEFHVSEIEIVRK